MRTLKLLLAVVVLFVMAGCASYRKYYVVYTVNNSSGTAIGSGNCTLTAKHINTMQDIAEVENFILKEIRKQNPIAKKVNYISNTKFKRGTK